MAGEGRVRSVVLLSGGLDSAANLAFCRLLDEPALALTIDYGQRAAQREGAAGRALARHFGVRHEVVSLPWLGELGGSALTDCSREVPRPRPDRLDELAAAQASAKAVWVPNRNGVLIQVGAAYAERSGAARVVVGFNREEAATFPDNSAEFLRRATAALALSTANTTAVHCYTTELDKREIVAELARAVPSFPFALLWSCYFGGEKACGECESCRRFARATSSPGGHA